jgi:hypothetical protein
MKTLASFALLLISLSASQAQQYQGTYGAYGSKRTLTPAASRYDLYWTSNATQITFEVNVALITNSTWVLFAIGNPAANQADGVLAWLNPDLTAPATLLAFTSTRKQTRTLSIRIQIGHHSTRK